MDWGGGILWGLIVFESSWSEHNDENSLSTYLNVLFMLHRLCSIK
jgi:hypothetical protein